VTKSHQSLVRASVLIAVGIPVAAAGVLASTGQKKGAPAPKPVTTSYAAQVQFRDLTTDAIHSDSGTTYVNGVAGVQAEFQVTTSGGAVTSDQFLLQFGAVKHVTRTIHYTYSPTTTSCSAGAGPAGSISDPGYFDTLTISTMPVGSVGARKGGFHTAPGAFRFTDRFSDPVYPYECGDMLVVSHPTSTTWIVTTDTDPNATYTDPLGNVLFPAGNPGAQVEGVGSMTQLDQEAGPTFTANYRMPFQVTITCLSSSTCPH
jgi:hypothetical protein